MTDIFPALALAVEPPEPDILSRPPRDPREPILRPADFKRYGFEAFAITAGSMCSYGYAVARYRIGPQANSAAFMTLTAAQLMHAYSCRSDRHSIFDRKALQPNPYLKLALAEPARCNWRPWRCLGFEACSEPLCRARWIWRSSGRFRIAFPCERSHKSQGASI